MNLFGPMIVPDRFLLHPATSPRSIVLSDERGGCHVQSSRGTDAAWLKGAFQVFAAQAIAGGFCLSLIQSDVCLKGYGLRCSYA